MSINRRIFLKKSVYAGGAIMASSMVPMNLIASLQTDYLTILHTNDVHSRLEPFPMDGSKNEGMGGVSARAALIEKIRKEVPNVLLLDAGDIFQGTPYFNMFGGELELKLMSMMGYDAGTMGNHDFDNGLDGFLKVLPNAQFPFICSNYDFKNTILDGKTHPFKIFKKGGIKVGIFGLGINLDGLVGKKQYQETQYINPVDVAQHYSNYLKKDKKCDLVICLSHLGYEYKNEENLISDRKLVAQTENIDLILGGHTHTFLPEPQSVQNRQGKNVLINQVGFAGLLLGRIDFYFDKNKNIKNIAWSNQVIDERILV